MDRDRTEDTPPAEQLRGIDLTLDHPVRTDLQKAFDTNPSPNAAVDPKAPGQDKVADVLGPWPNPTGERVAHARPRTSRSNSRSSSSAEP